MTQFKLNMLFKLKTWSPYACYISRLRCRKLFLAVAHVAKGYYSTLSQAIIPNTLLYSPTKFPLLFFFPPTIPHVIIFIQGLIGGEVAHYNENTDLILHFIEALIPFSVRLVLSTSLAITCGNMARL